MQPIDSAAPVLDAYHALGQWLAGKPRTTRRPASEVRLGVVTPSWRPHVHDQHSDTVDRAACTCCVLDQVRTRLRRRDICAPGSTRWGDPLAELLTPGDWDHRRDTLCEELALDPDPATIAAQLAASLDTAWRRTAAGYPANTGLRIETRGGRDEIVVAPPDAEVEPAPCTCSNTPTTRPTGGPPTTFSVAVRGATPWPAPSSTASTASCGGTTRSGRKTSSTASAS